jgi:hypothetical protein
MLKRIKEQEDIKKEKEKIDALINDSYPLSASAARLSPITNDNTPRLLVPNAPSITALTYKRGKRTIEKHTGCATFNIQPGHIHIENFKKALNARDEKLFTYIGKLLLDQNKQNLETINKRVKINVRDYQKLRGLRDYNTTKEQISESLDKLYNTTIDIEFPEKEFKGKNKITKIVKKLKTRIISVMETIEKKEKKIIDNNITVPTTKNGSFIIHVTEDVSKNLLKQWWHKKELPPFYWKASNSCSQLINYLAILKTNSYKKQSKTRKINIPTILDRISDLPDYEEVVKSKKRSTRERIIKPFNKILDELEREGLCKCKYRDKSGKYISKQQSVSLNWEAFKDLSVEFTNL